VNKLLEIKDKDKSDKLLKELENPILEYDEEHNQQPPLNDFDYKPKRGKKGKYLKDWQ